MVDHPQTLQIRLATPDELHPVHSLVMAAFAQYAGLPNPSSALRETVDDVRRMAESGGAVVAILDGRPSPATSHEPMRVIVQREWLPDRTRLHELAKHVHDLRDFEDLVLAICLSGPR